jgi:hypothetical protein
MMSRGQVWNIQFTYRSIQYAGTLTITSEAGTDRFSGHIDLSYQNKDEHEKVREQAQIAISGNRVSITCSNAQMLLGTADYDPDNFEFTMHSATEGQGTEGNGGAASLRLSSFPPPPQPFSSAMMSRGQVWNIQFTDRNTQYSGTLTITSDAGTDKFIGYIDLSFETKGENNQQKDEHNQQKDEHKKVREQAQIAISGNRVSITCSDAQVLQGKPGYNPDNFDFTMRSATEGEGTAKDTKGNGGAASLVRQS